MAQAPLPETPQKLDDLVEYQDGSIVSRTMVKQDHGTVTLFAFDQGQALSEHTTPYDALLLVLAGEAAVTIAGTTYKVATGEVLRLPANQPHAVRAHARFKMLLIMIRD